MAKGIVFSFDAVFSVALVVICLVTFSSWFYYPPLTLWYGDVTSDANTIFDKNGWFDSFYRCPPTTSSMYNLTVYLINLTNYTNFMFAYINVSIYVEGPGGVPGPSGGPMMNDVLLQCVLEGSYGNWTNTRSSSTRVFSIVVNGTQYFGVANLTVGG